MWTPYDVPINLHMHLYSLKRTSLNACELNFKKEMNEEVDVLHTPTRPVNFGDFSALNLIRVLLQCFFY